MLLYLSCCVFFNDPATTEIYTYLTHSFPTRRSSDLVPPPRGMMVRPSSINPATSPAISASVSGISTTNGYRSEEHTSELQSLMRISYAVFCLKKKKQKNKNN